MSIPSAKEQAAPDAEGLDFLARRGRALGFPLTLLERKLIAEEADRQGDGDGLMSISGWERLTTSRWREHQERLTLSEFMIKSHDHQQGQNLLKWTSRLGISFFALSGAHVAGEAGMHAIGAIIVGSVTALGGATLNHVMVGAAATGPVGWMRDTTLLGLTIAASLLGFYAWPLLELQLRDPADSEDSKEICAEERLQQAERVRYALESVALGALAVVGAQQGIIRGLHPLVSATLGVTAPFGGVFRDLMCQRELRLGSHSGCQSYAVASFLASSTYVGLRQLHVWNCPGTSSKVIHGGLPIGLRIVVSASVAVAFRVYSWQQKPDELFSSMEDCAAAHDEYLRRLCSR